MISNRNLFVFLVPSTKFALTLAFLLNCYFQLFDNAEPRALGCYSNVKIWFWSLVVDSNRIMIIYFSQSEVSSDFDICITFCCFQNWEHKHWLSRIYRKFKIKIFALLPKKIFKHLFWRQIFLKEIYKYFETKFFWRKESNTRRF